MLSAEKYDCASTYFTNFRNQQDYLNDQKNQPVNATCINHCVLQIKH